MRSAEPLAVLLLSALGASCTGDVAAAPAAAPPDELDPGAPLLVDHTRASGLVFEHLPGGIGHRELPETMGAGVGLLDVERDGDLDVYLVQSGPVREPGDRERRDGAHNELFLGRRGASFERAPAALGADDPGYGMGCAVGDVDGDGYDDLFVANWGPNALFRNRHGRFERWQDSGLAPRDRWSVSAAFFDAEGDGDLDLFVVNYVLCAPSSHLDPGLNPLAPRGFRLYPSPDVFPAAGDRFYLNAGAAPHFEDRTEEAGFGASFGKGLGVVVTDVDLDGALDLYVANDGTPNHLHHNRGDGTFVERGQELGVAFNDDGLSEAGMGVDAGDVDGDGYPDLVVTNLDNETNSLYLNRLPERVGFRDRTRTSGLAEPSRQLLGFGVVLEDLDLDGDLDLFVGNGHVIDNVRIAHSERTHAQPNQLFLNEDGRFLAAPERLLGPGVGAPFVSRGTAVGDLDGDGLFDLVVTNNRGPAQVLLTRPGPADWLRLELVGPLGNPRGLGATVELRGATRTLLRRVESARSYASASEPAVVTGLVEPLVEVVVCWPGGRRERFAAQPDWSRTCVLLRYGTGEPVAPRGPAD